MFNILQLCDPRKDPSKLRAFPVVSPELKVSELLRRFFWGFVHLLGFFCNHSVKDLTRSMTVFWRTYV